MIVGNQSRLQRSLIVNGIPLSRGCENHTPPTITARMREYKGQAIPVEIMAGVEKMEAKFKMSGSIAATRLALGEGYASLIDIVVSDVGLIGNNGARYAHTYVYAAKVKSIAPATGDDGEESAEVTLSVASYEFKMDGVTIDEIDGRTGKLMIGGQTIVEALF